MAVNGRKAQCHVAAVGVVLIHEGLIDSWLFKRCKRRSGCGDAPSWAADAIGDDVAAHCDDRRRRRETKLDLREIGRKSEEIVVKKNQDSEISRDIKDCIALCGQP